MANKRLNATITIGGAISGALKSALDTTKSKLGQVGDAVRRLEREQRMLSNAIETFGRQGKNVDSLRARYAAVTAQIEKQRAALLRLKSIEDARARNAQRAADLRGMVGGAVATVVTAGAPIVQAAKFENAMLGVAKQLDGARDESGQLTAKYYEMAKAVQLLGRELPIPTNKIAEMTAAGLRMGVAEDQILQFVRRAAEMSTAFELPEGELAEQMGKIAGLYKIPIPAIGDLADSINYLDDNAIAKGGDIIDYLQRVGGVASSVKVTGKEMAALGSTLLTLGERTETAGTATNAMFQKLAAADKGTKKFRSAIAEIGLSASEIQKGMQKDAAGTLLKVLDAVGKLKDEKQLGVLVELVGLEHSDTMAKLAQNTEEFRKQLKLANSEAAKGSMSREFQARMQTTTAMWEVTKNTITEVSVNIGSVLLPAVNKVLRAFSGATSAVADFARENRTLVENVGVVVGAFAAFGAVKMGITAVTWAVTALNIAVRANPIGILVTALAAGAILVVKNWDSLRAFMVGTFEGLKAGLQPLGAAFVSLYENLGFVKIAFDAVAGVVQWAWDGLTKLIGPLSATKDQLDKAGAAGKVFGEMLAAGINFALTPLRLLIEGVTWINSNIGSAAEKVRSFFGAGGSAPSPAAASAPPALPAVPAMATARGAGATVTNTQTNTINITQQPGQDSKALAREVAAQLQRQQGVKQRGALYDGANQ